MGIYLNTIIIYIYTYIYIYIYIYIQTLTTRGFLSSMSQRWIPSTKARDAQLWCFPWSPPEWTVEQTDDSSVFNLVTAVPAVALKVAMPSAYMLMPLTPQEIQVLIIRGDKLSTICPILEMKIKNKYWYVLIFDRTIDIYFIFLHWGYVGVYPVS